MRSDLYQDLYQKEDSYWWMKGRRMFIGILLDRILKRSHPFRHGRNKWLASGSPLLTGATSILDAGCGTGRLMEDLQNYGEASGFDISDQALEFCRQRGFQNIIKADLNQKLPYPDESFDLITAIDVLEHIQDDKFALSELYRVLRIGGYMVITVPAHQFLWSYWDEAINHFRRYSKLGLAQKLESAGFHIRRLSYTNFFIFPLVWVLRNLRGFAFNKRRQQSTSDFIPLPKFLNWLMILVYRIETWVFSKRDLPMGVSLIALVQKNEKLKNQNEKLMNHC